MKVDFLLLDGAPKEYLDYLKSAEPLLNPGATVLADNTGVFADSTAPYLEYVRGEGCYTSRTVDVSFGYRDDVPDAMEVSIYDPQS